jgi:16S rRNA (guanine966-N2)-methyltransferase
VNQVRIIGGRWRRHCLKFSAGAGLRPTPDRVRETLFNWLGQDLTGLACLDLFAGSGALGFEAASRGASRVVMVEHSGKAVAALKENAQRLQAEAVELVGMDALKYLVSCMASGADRFDVAFLDPPYRLGWLERLEPWLDRLLTPDAALYVEAEYPVTALGNWHPVRQGKAGQVYFHLLRQESSV